MLKLDKKKVEFNAQHSANYQIFYGFGDSDKFPDYKEWRYKSCYSNFLSQLRSNKGIKKSFTTFKIIPTTVELTKEDVINWINLCKKNKFLPKYIVPKDCFKTNKDGKVVRGFLTINIDTDMPQSMLYLWLDSFRKLREDPGFVKAILYLCNDKKVNFFIAFVLATHFNITATGHHCLLLSKDVYTRTNEPKPKTMDDGLNLKMVRSLYKFINDDKLKKGKKVGTATHWHCNSFIAEITSADLVVPIKDLNDKKVIEIVSEMNCNKAAELHSKLHKSKKIGG